MIEFTICLSILIAILIDLMQMTKFCIPFSALLGSDVSAVRVYVMYIHK